jgi:DNA-binding NtrC family response regulator
MVFPIWMTGGLATIGPVTDDAFRNSRRQQRGRMMVLESDDVLRQVILDALGPAIPVVGAGFARQAFEFLTTGTVSIALVGLQVPDLNGPELLRRVRQYLPASKVIVISDSGNHELVRQVVELGAVDFLEKPFSLTELYQSLDIAIRGLARPLDVRTFQLRTNQRSRLRRQALLACA